MKTAERKKKKRDEAEEPRERPNRRTSSDTEEGDRRIRVATVSPGRQRTATRDEGDLLMRIHNGLHEVEEWRRLAHYYDGEIERLGAETRRMIGEMQDELKAA